MSTDIGPQVKSDTDFVAKCRLKQSEYRARILCEEYGVGPTPNSVTKYGNYLIDGEKTGKNFVSPAAFQYAKQRVVDKVICPELTIDEFRLFNNMMSSQPLCFNLFSDLRELLLVRPEECSSVTKELFSELNWIESVLYVGVEFIPVPIEKYLDDKTAFDAIIVTQDKAGKHGLIAIETKYTDILGENTSARNDKKNALIQESKLFSADAVKRLKREGYKQIYRNYLLAYAYASFNKFKYFCNVIVSPKADELSHQEISEVRSSLSKNPENIFKIDLEEFVKRGMGSGSEGISSVYKTIFQRYIP